MALERGLEGRDQLLKLVKRHAREIQELHRTGLQLGEPYTCHGSCLLSLYCDVRGASYQKESGINSIDERRAKGSDTGDVLSMLILAQADDGSPMSPRQVHDEALTLMLAGHETTALALSWT